jgi:hypothetical protein
MADRYRTASGWSVEVVERSATPDHSDGQQLRVRYCGFYVADVRIVTHPSSGSLFRPHLPRHASLGDKVTIIRIYSAEFASLSVLTETRVLAASCTVTRMDESSPQSNCDWRKASRSYNEANCVEVAFAGGHVFVRDSKAVADGGPHLKLSATTWQSLIKSIKDGELDL